MIKGIGLDDEGRCRHWHSFHDVVANRCAQCDEFYACYQCHDAMVTHHFCPMPLTDERVAVLCGACHFGMTGQMYLKANYYCPKCHHPFNNQCARHIEIYFS
ncbi:hypothetical protein FE407_00210 [Leuconostoc carnosum]|uniref:Zn-finger protein n=2 Tax=Leuconostoc carnosum TaxID=1252 RepID=K0DBP6_LEUCJ|nr:CHY zinc finger protein [Leuconostoc carnosum]MDV8936786.1 CHY zinc finger protein [Leuconostoc sp.]AFT80992.1 Zn-finger protein [Leuconostoc carnosum JB16]KAA8327217.1 hypothetical protein FE404_00210 [Leuconostoc carnosum]KAA8332357.1 hypothetical protein FE409_00310 [Leuconostoc carnosum]KAA8364306.1 hypothetical protein FE407_00210 [Leuconostoc carnosum]